MIPTLTLSDRSEDNNHRCQKDTTSIGRKTGRRLLQVSARLTIRPRWGVLMRGARSQTVARYLEIANDCGLLVATLAIGEYSEEADPDAGRRHRRRTDV